MNSKNLLKIVSISSVLILIIGTSNIANAEELTIPIQLIDEQGVSQEIGKVTLEDNEYGLLITPDLTNIPTGIHGFHLHENPSCDAGVKDGKVTPGLAAGGHFDPEKTDSHEGPYGEGHLGDLPPLIASSDGTVTTPILAPRLYPDDLQGRALIVHLNGDNFSDNPQKLGGGGARIACGVIE